jgi:hypothetical protein
MATKNTGLAAAQRHAMGISAFAKKRKLLQLSEDEFRDLVVRPVFLKMGLEDGRDLCGSDEEGKDAVFFSKDSMQDRIAYAVQTKKGKLSMARVASSNITEAIAQLRTAIETEICLVATRERIRPHFVMLCCSGDINKAAREHIIKTLNDSRLGFRDGEDFINLIDKQFPEFWYGIDSDKFPYYRSLKLSLESRRDYLPMSGESQDDSNCPIPDDAFIPLYLRRTSQKPDIRGQKLQKKDRSVLLTTSRFM